MPPTKKPLPTKSIPNPINRPVGHLPASRPIVAQLKTGSSAPSRPQKSPLSRPAGLPQAVQPKLATLNVERKAPVAPPVYRPQFPKILQQKTVGQRREVTAPLIRGPQRTPGLAPGVVVPGTISTMRAGSIQLAARAAAAAAKPIAREAKISAVKEAFPILGARMETEYGKIEHELPEGAELDALLKTYNARLKVLKMFRQVMMANGMNGASKADNLRFKLGEAGHIEALLNVAARIEALVGDDEDLPKGVWTSDEEVMKDLAKVKLKKGEVK